MGQVHRGVFDPAHAGHTPGRGPPGGRHDPTSTIHESTPPGVETVHLVGAGERQESMARARLGRAFHHGERTTTFTGRLAMIDVVPAAPAASGETERSPGDGAHRLGEDVASPPRQPPRLVSRPAETAAGACQPARDGGETAHGPGEVSGRAPDLPGASRFWSYVERCADDNGCWEWIGYRQPDGYGIWTVTERRDGRGLRRKYRAHRYAWAALNGPIPPGRRVLHRPGCENPPCCNPAHLYLGTAADNARDRDRPERRDVLRRRRLARVGHHPLPGISSGEEPGPGQGWLPSW